MTTEELYRTLHGPLLNYLRKRTRDAAAAEDLMHDVMAKLLVEAGSPKKTPRNIAGWLFTVARNSVIDWQRRTRPTQPLTEDLLGVEDSDEPVGAELANCLRPLAEKLPPIYRDAVLASEFEGLSLKAISIAQGLSVPAIKSRTSRGRKMLQEQLVQCCRIALTASGRIDDYDQTAAFACKPKNRKT